MRRKVAGGERRVINERGKDVSIRVRINADDKAVFQGICDELMLNPSEVLRIMVVNFVKTGGEIVVNK